MTTELVRSFIETAQLPGAMERIYNLVLMLATDFAPGQHTTLKTAALCALIGTATEPEASWVMNQARGMHYVLWVQAEGSGNQGSAYVGVTLTIDGWRRHAELMRDGARSRHAFMAMKFGNEELSRVYSQRMRPAVAETGFDLRTTNEDHKTAGSIDNRMRVEIRTSRFTVCDLTHGNQGAYWEAGFAEGLGRPVFYTCRSDVLRDRTHADHPHFDTAHQLIIPWDATSPAGAMQELKDVIRATLPDEARMQDNRAI